MAFALYEPPPSPLVAHAQFVEEAPSLIGGLRRTYALDDPFPVVLAKAQDLMRTGKWNREDGRLTQTWHWTDGSGVHVWVAEVVRGPGYLQPTFPGAVTEHKGAKTLVRFLRPSRFRDTFRMLLLGRRASHE